MTVTKEQAILAGLHHTIFHDENGNRWRSNGLCKTWPVPRHREFRLPIKRGVPGVGDGAFGYIFVSAKERNNDKFHLPGKCNCDLVKAHNSEHKRLHKVDIIAHATREHNLDKSHPGWDEEH